MKKLLFGAVSLLLLASCSGNNDASQKTGEDSDRTSDSITQVEAEQAAAEQAAAEQAAAEQARLDSLRTDSIKKVEANAFYNKLPDPKKIVWDIKAGDYLKKLGFVGTTHGDEEDGEGTYILTDGDKTCKVHFTTESNFGDTEVTITGDDNAFEKFYKRASKMKATYIEGGTDVTKKGNTIYISSYGA